MGLFDVEGFGENKEVQEDKEDIKSSFQENGFDKSIVEDVDPRVKMIVINQKFNLGKLLRNLGYDLDHGNIYCPFHMDKLTGKPSARYHEDSDLLYCFSENKIYSAFHALRYLYNKDTNEIFRQIWVKMSDIERKEILDRFEDGSLIEERIPKEWNKYRDEVLSYFKKGKVTYTQYKRALYKVFMIVDEDNEVKGV